jgi:mono/diheme cytochrome c family protein
MRTALLSSAVLLSMTLLATPGEPAVRTCRNVARANVRVQQVQASVAAFVPISLPSYGSYAAQVPAYGGQYVGTSLDDKLDKLEKAITALTAIIAGQANGNAPKARSAAAQNCASCHGPANTVKAPIYFDAGGSLLQDAPLGQMVTAVALGRMPKDRNISEAEVERFMTELDQAIRGKGVAKGPQLELVPEPQKEKSK